MCYERQPRSKCSCGHPSVNHKDKEHPLFAENGEGACKLCECPEYDGLPPRYPRWMFMSPFLGEVTSVEYELSRPGPPDPSRPAEFGPDPGAKASLDKPESHYRDLLARQVGGRIEVTLPFGRADVMTDTTVYEVEPTSRWTDGIAQALQYAAQVPQRGAIALYGNKVPLEKVRAKLASLPEPGLELWWLEGGQFVRKDATAA